MVRGLGHLRAKDFDDLRRLCEPKASRHVFALDWQVQTEPDGLPQLPSATIRQVALNLLLNAGQAAGSNRAVGFAVHARADGLTMSVSDTGPGLGNADLARLLWGRSPSPGRWGRTAP